MSQRPMGPPPTDLPPPQPSNAIANQIAKESGEGNPATPVTPVVATPPPVGTKMSIGKTLFGSVGGMAVLLFGLLWTIFGIVGFVLSLICFGYSGSTGEKLFGLLASIMMGPFYFIYYFSSGTYCKKMPSTLF